MDAWTSEQTSGEGRQPSGGRIGIVLPPSEAKDRLRPKRFLYGIVLSCTDCTLSTVQYSWVLKTSFVYEGVGGLINKYIKYRQFFFLTIIAGLVVLRVEVLGVRDPLHVSAEVVVYLLLLPLLLKVSATFSFFSFF